MDGPQHREAKSCLKVFNLPKGAGYVVMGLREACVNTGSLSSKKEHRNCCITLKIQDM